MSRVEIGQLAPSFRLPSGQGPELGLEDYRGRKSLIVWFTEGMPCAFCRQHMSQLARLYPEIEKRDTEILEVTPTPLERARLYVRKFHLPFPYLADPDFAVRRAWGLEVRRHGIAYYATALYEGFKLKPPTSDFGGVSVPLREYARTFIDKDMGFYVLDKRGVVRFALGGSYYDWEIHRPRLIPSKDELLRELDRCDERQ